MHRFILVSIPRYCKTREAASHMMTSKCDTTRLFLRHGCDINEIYEKPLQDHPLWILLSSHYFPGSVESRGWSEKPIWRNESHSINIWMHFLQDQNIDVDFTEARDVSLQGATLLRYFIIANNNRAVRSERGTTEAIYMLCAMGANVSASMPDIDAQPLHLVAMTPYSTEKASYIEVRFEILLKFGADPCARDGRGLTVTDVACSRGWRKQWVEALKKCDKSQVVVEQLEAERVGRTEPPFDNAMRTGVDVTDLSKSSIEGLSRRTVARGDRLND